MADLPMLLAGIASSAEAKSEASKIGAAIRNTFDMNRKQVAPRFVDHRRKGYYCYEWAYAYEDAFKLESSGKFFKVAVESASKVTGEGVHFWIAIESLETGKIIYVDDGFMTGDYVHTSRPENERYQYDLTPLYDQTRKGSDPPPAYDSLKRQYGK